MLCHREYSRTTGIDLDHLRYLLARERHLIEYGLDDRGLGAERLAARAGVAGFSLDLEAGLLGQVFDRRGIEVLVGEPALQIEEQRIRLLVLQLARQFGTYLLERQRALLEDLVETHDVITEVTSNRPCNLAFRKREDRLAKLAR